MQENTKKIGHTFVKMHIVLERQQRRLLYGMTPPSAVVLNIPKILSLLINKHHGQNIAVHNIHKLVTNGLGIIRSV